MKLVDKVWNALGLVETEELSDDAPSKQDVKPVSDKKTEKAAKFLTEPKPLPRQNEPATKAGSVDGKGKLVLTQLDHFDDSRQIAEHLTAGRMVVVNFERTDAETTKRTIDFMSGITYAVGGTVQRISTAIFLFAPAHVQVLANESQDIPDSLALSSAGRGQKRGRDQ